MVRAFVVGNFVLGFLLTVSSSAVFWMMRLPYPMLVGPLSGFLSLVPYVDCRSPWCRRCFRRWRSTGFRCTLA